MSNNRKHRPTKAHWLALGVTLILSWLFLNFDLEGKSLWTDELFTAEWSFLSPKEVIQHTAADVHPPLYFLLLSLWTNCAGHSDFALRWFSIASGWLSIAVLYRLGRDLENRGAGWFSASLWGLSPPIDLVRTNGPLLQPGRAFGTALHVRALVLSQADEMALLGCLRHLFTGRPAYEYRATLCLYVQEER